MCSISGMRCATTVMVAWQSLITTSQNGHYVQYVWERKIISSAVAIAGPAVWSDRNVQAERYRSGSLPSPYPVRVAGVAFKQSGRTVAMERRAYQEIAVNTALT